MRVLQIDDRSPYRSLIGVGGLGTGIFFALDGNHTLGRTESRAGALLDVRDYCKLHIISHYVAKLLGAHPSGKPFHVLPVGKIGDDGAGRFVLKEMRDVGIDTTLVQTVKGKPTLLSVCFQYPDGSGGNITTDNSAASELSEPDLQKASEFLELHGRSVIALAAPEVPLAARHVFLKLASASGAYRVASFVEAEIVEAQQLSMFEALDLLALNESEAHVMTGCPLLAQAPQPFLERCLSLTQNEYPGLKIVVSAGKHGAYAFADSCVNFCPAPHVPVASTAGAGDALLGGVISALAAGMPLVKPGPMRRSWNDGPLTTALEFGVLLASYKVGSTHTIQPNATLDNLLAFAENVGVGVALGVGRPMARSGD